jgi:hypothetical protein
MARAALAASDGGAAALPAEARGLPTAGVRADEGRAGILDLPFLASTEIPYIKRAGCGGIRARAPSRSEDWQGLWSTLDEDGGGTLDKAEVGVLLKLIGRGELDVDEMMAELDTVLWRTLRALMT